jgi:hypothetical protein
VKQVDLASWTITWRRTKRSCRSPAWRLIPANDNLARNLMVSQLPVEALEGLKMRYREPVDGVSAVIV